MFRYQFSKANFILLPVIIETTEFMEKYLIITLIILSYILSFWAVLDLNKTRFIDHHKRWFWIISFYTLPLIAPIVYFQVKRKYIKKRRSFLNPSKLN